MTKNLGSQILALKAEGKTFTQIIETLGCSRGTISYHTGVGQKIKTKTRQRNRRSKIHPYKSKLERFLYQKPNHSKRFVNLDTKTRKMLTDKIHAFHQERKTKMVTQHNFTVDDVIAKFGDQPRCYLTGELIDIQQPRTYHFDHILPVDRGGDNSLDNLGLTTKNANMAKTNMTKDEFIALCKKVLIHNGYEVQPKVG